MSHELEPVTHHIGGDSIQLPFAVPDHDSDEPDARKDLTGATIQWGLALWDETIILSTADEGVHVRLTEPEEGEFYIEIDAGVGEGLDSSYTEVMRITTTTGERQTWIGEFTVEDTAPFDDVPDDF